jgi:two-component system response regulator AtoC
MIGFEYNSTNFDDCNIVSANCGLFRRVCSLIQSVSPTDIPVLIVGEMGTPKPIFVKEVHRNSKRRNGRLFTVDCANPDVGSLEIELFGHESNGNKHYAMHKIGKIEQANGSSILLSEIGMTPSAIQTRLLQVIQEQEIYRVGGHGSVPTDVRIIATTSGNLESAIKNGSFRKDLFYRISVFPIIIPSLRDHSEDIEFLANEFLILMSKKANKKIKGISSDAMSLLKDYGWPGNILELEKSIEHAISFEETEEIQSASLPKAILHTQNQIAKPDLPFIDPQTRKILPLYEIERRSIIHALRITGNNIKKTAKILGINRATVYRKLEKYNLL